MSQNDNSALEQFINGLELFIKSRGLIDWFLEQFKKGKLCGFVHLESHHKECVGVDISLSLFENDKRENLITSAKFIIASEEDMRCVQSYFESFVLWRGQF